MIDNENDYLKKIDKIQARYTLVEPKRDIKEFEHALKLCDAFTKKTIIEYLELDNFEFVKNISRTVNDESASNVISFMDG